MTNHLVLTVHNLHDWGRGSIRKSGDMDMLQAIANELSRRTGSKKIKLVYAAIKEHFIDDLKDLYPIFDWVHYAEHELSSQNTYLLPLLDVRGQEEAFAEEFVDFYTKVSEVPHFTMNITHQSTYYSDMLARLMSEKRDAIAQAINRVLTTSTQHFIHSKVSFDEHLLTGRILKTSQLNGRHQLVFWDETQFNEHLHKVARDKRRFDGDLQGSVAKSVTFQRPSRYKGFDLWLKSMVARPDKAANSLFICPVHELSNFKQIREDLRRKEGIEFDDLIASGLDADSRLLPRVIDRAYTQTDDWFNKAIADASIYTVANNYEMIEIDHPVIENALINAVYDGFKLEWVDASVKAADPEIASQLTSLNRMSYAEQVEYLRSHHNVTTFVSHLYQLLQLQEKTV